VLYFPLARPLADMLADALATIKPQSPHVRAGTGLDDVPVFSSSPPPPAPRRSSSSPAPRMSIPAPRPAVPCKLCGGPGGPICSECEAQMK
jgi:hypothetical protein